MHICIHICNPEGAGFQKMTRCLLHFHHLVLFLNQFHTLPRSISVSILTTKEKNNQSRGRGRRTKDAFYVKACELCLSSLPLSLKSYSFSLSAVGKSCKLAAKSDRIVEACSILHVSELHHWTLQSQQELQSGDVLFSFFLFFLLRTSQNITAQPDLTPSDYSPAIRGAAGGWLGRQWYLLGPGYHSNFFFFT